MQLFCRDPKKMLDAAKAMKLSAKDLLGLEIIDEIISEPLGGAHRDKNLILENLRVSINKNLEYFKLMSADEVFNNRKKKFLRIGRNKGFINNLDDLSNLQIKNKNLDQILKFKKIILSAVLLGLTAIILTIFFLKSSTTVFKLFTRCFTSIISRYFLIFF